MVDKMAQRSRCREIVRAAALVISVVPPLLGAAPAAEVAEAPNATARTAYPVAYEELLDITGVFAEARVSAQTMVGRLSEDNPTVPPVVWTRLAEKISDRETLAPLYVPIYARHLTEADTEGLLAFYRSAPGQRWLQRLPSIQQESRGDSEKWAATLAEDLLSEEARPDEADSTGADVADPRVASIHELLSVSGSLDQARHTMNLLIDRLQQAAQASGEGSSFWNQARTRITDEKSLLQLWTPAFAHYLSDDDVRAMIAFYESPLGQRYVAALPDIRSESLDAATKLANTAARSAAREVLGPRPQYRLMHPEGGEPRTPQT